MSDRPCSDIDYADDVFLLAKDDVQWPYILESFDTVQTHPGQKQMQNVASWHSPPSCVVSGHQVEEVNRFTYLGSDVDSSGYSTPEILRRIGLAPSNMSQLDRVWK